MKKKGKMSVMMRVVSIMLVLALVVTSVQTVVRPGRDAEAASAESMGDMEMLSASHVPDSEVRNFYTILCIPFDPFLYCHLTIHPFRYPIAAMK